MNKIIMTLGVASSLLTTPTEKDGTEVYYSQQLIHAMNNIEYMKSWVSEDVNSGRMETEIAEFYFENLDETYGFINDFYQNQCK
jgi:hypothetical protein